MFLMIRLLSSTPTVRSSSSFLVRALLLLVDDLFIRKAGLLDVEAVLRLLGVLNAVLELSNHEAQE